MKDPTWSSSVDEGFSAADGCKKWKWSLRLEYMDAAGKRQHRGWGGFGLLSEKAAEEELERMRPRVEMLYDYYRVIVAEMLGVPVEAVTRKMRNVAKQLTFGAADAAEAMSMLRIALDIGKKLD